MEITAPEKLLPAAPASRAPANDPVPPIISGAVFVDRKSRFQAHIARATTIDAVRAVMRALREDPRLAAATHLIMAYRLAAGDADRDDGGEGGAGDRMLHLLHRMAKTDIVAVVVRWYGGIQLGPDRFKHITGVLKKLIEESGFE